MHQGDVARDTEDHIHKVLWCLQLYTGPQWSLQKGVQRGNEVSKVLLISVLWKIKE